MGKEYLQLIDGEPITFATSARHRFACCDCGLVHDFVLVPSEDGKEIGLAVRRNKRATGARRKSKVHPFQEVANDP